MDRQLLQEILTAYGATGREDRVREVIARALTGHVDSLSADAMGNLIAVKKRSGEGERIMLAAHMDHIGLAVIDADERGFLRLCSVGGINARNMLAQHVAFENGVTGVVGADEEIKGDLQVSDLYVDIGAESRDDALSRVEIGDVCVMQPRVTRLGRHRLASPAMDDRIACYVLAQAMLSLPEKTENEIVAVFTVQEEVGLRGATTAAFAIRPDMGIAIDVTGVGDVPKVKDKLALSLGGGAAIKIMDRSLIATPCVVERMTRAAQEKGIPVQREVLPYGGTDGGAIQKTLGGVPTGVISIPCRYVHSAAETVDLRDVQAALDLLLACIA